MIVIKKSGKEVYAWELGAGSYMEEKMIKEGKMKKCKNGRYELMSREVKSGKKGETASIGDYFKVDDEGRGFPYPNSREFFKKNHRHISGDMYEQISKPLYAWCLEEGETEEIRFLVDEKELVITKDDEENYFKAPLWGSVLSADKDAIIVFYKIDRDSNGVLTDIDYNFVAREEFERTYDVIT